MFLSWNFSDSLQNFSFSFSQKKSKNSFSFFYYQAPVLVIFYLRQNMIYWFNNIFPDIRSPDENEISTLPSWNLSSEDSFKAQVSRPGEETWTAISKQTSESSASGNWNWQHYCSSDVTWKSFRFSNDWCHKGNQ